MLSSASATSPPLSPLLVTLQFDSDSFERLSELRTRYFPRQRNIVPTHLTLFHALPGEREDLVRDTLAKVCGRAEKLALHFTDLRFLGRGVAINVECPELLRIRGDLARNFRPFLGAQDAQNWKHPHVTIQNKVAPDAARATFDQLSDGWQSWNGQGEGLLLWYYRGGPWEKAGEYSFPSESPK